jgi:chromosome segregation ATPase
MRSIEERKSDLKNRIAALNAELTPVLATAKNLQERIAHLESDLGELMDEKFRRREFQTKTFEEVRELR